mgnify:CR=1 FL=1
MQAEAGAAMSRILGIDPGSRITGYGLIEFSRDKPRYVASGTIRVEGKALDEKLRCIYSQLTELIQLYRPDAMAIEQVFVHRNPDSALKLGQARGAAICAGAMGGLPVAEYTPSEIKQSVVGSGRADKSQVQYMIRALLSLTGTLQVDASDALAVAICHAHRRHLERRLANAVQGG